MKRSSLSSNDQFYFKFCSTGSTQGLAVTRQLHTWAMDMDPRMAAFWFLLVMPIPATNAASSLVNWKRQESSDDCLTCKIQSLNDIFEI